MFNFPLYHWHLEVSTKCTLRCPRCPRTSLKGHYKVGELSLDAIKSIFSQPAFSENALKVTFCGGQGDPIYHSRFLEVVEYFKSFQKPKIVTIVTNGSYKSPEWWKDLRGLLKEGDDVVFSVDGYDAASNQQYRVNSDWDSIINGMKTMAGGPAMVIWNAIYFRFNQERIEEIRQMAQSLGLDGFRLTKSSLFGSNYPEFIDPALGYDPLEPSSGKFSSSLRMLKDMQWFHSKSDRFQSYGKAYLKFNRVRAEILHSAYTNSELKNFLPNCMFGFRGNYVDVEGNFYPCSWVSHPKKEFSSDAFRSKIMKFDLSRLSLLTRSLEEVLKDPLWKELSQLWSGHEASPPRECFTHCKKEKFPQETYQKFMRLGGISP